MFALAVALDSMPQCIMWAQCSVGELADVMDTEPHLLAHDLLPVALPAAVEKQDRHAVDALADYSGQSVAAMLHQYGHHVIAKQMYEGVGGTLPGSLPLEHLAALRIRHVTLSLTGEVLKPQAATLAASCTSSSRCWWIKTSFHT